MSLAHPFPLCSRKSSFFLVVLSSLLLVLMAILSLLMTSAHAAQVTVAWDANSDPAVTGYRVHYGTALGSYTSHIDVGNATSCVISGLLEGLTYYFAATAYDSSGHESDYSPAVNYTVPQAPAPSRRRRPPVREAAEAEAGASLPRLPSEATMRRRSSSCRSSGTVSCWPVHRESCLCNFIIACRPRLPISSARMKFSDGLRVCP